MLISIAGIVAFSRIFDHKHHPVDVIFGSGVGIFLAISTVCYLFYHIKVTKFLFKGLS
jgi:membrane-associated phospholipid phosphatase